jgi:hypothetical protein
MIYEKNIEIESSPANYEEENSQSEEHLIEPSNQYESNASLKKQQDNSESQSNTEPAILKEYRTGRSNHVKPETKFNQFIEKLKAYEKVKSEKLDIIKRRMDEKRLNTDYIPIIDKRSRKIALSLNQTFEERQFKPKKENFSGSQTPSSTKKPALAGPPSCYFITKRKISPENMVHPPEQNKNTNKITQEKINKEYTAIIESLSNPSSYLTFPQFQEILERLNMISSTTRGDGNYDANKRAKQLWECLYPNGEQALSDASYKAICAILLGNDPNNKIAIQYKDMYMNRLAYKSMCHNKSSTTCNSPTSSNDKLFRPEICQASKKMAQCYRNKIINTFDIKTINLYDMYKVHNDSREKMIGQRKMEKSIKESNNCTFAPKIIRTKKQSMDSNPLERSNQLYNLSKNKRQLSGINTIDLEYQKSESEITFIPKIIKRDKNHIKATERSPEVKGAKTVIARMKAAHNEKERIDMNRSLRTEVTSPSMKMSAKPCIFIDVDLGNKKVDRIIIFEADNPETVACKFAKKHSNHFIRIGFTYDC